MYFLSRSEAGQLLGEKLAKQYRGANVIVMAISSGAVNISEQIAIALQSPMTLLLTEEIDIPGESMMIGGISEGGNFAYSTSLTSGEIYGYVSEYHGYLEEQKRKAFQKINRLIEEGTLIDRALMHDKIVILVSDGLSSGISLDVAVDFLKPVRIQRLIVVAPVASVEAVDKLHVIADELHILDVKPNYMGTNHYYDENDIPSYSEAVDKINRLKAVAN